LPIHTDSRVHLPAMDQVRKLAGWVADEPAEPRMPRANGSLPTPMLIDAVVSCPSPDSTVW
jgi:hypothetical protein